MQTTRVWILVVVCVLYGGVQARQNSDLKADVDQLVSSLRSNFGRLNEKRTQWFANHHTMKTTLEKDHDSLKELLENSRRAVPLIWTSFASLQALQRVGGDTLVPSGDAKLPLVSDFVSRTRGFLLEVVFDTGLSAFEIQIVGEGRPDVVAVVRVDPDLRTLTLLDGPREYLVERASMDSDDFPARDAFEQPFRVSVQTWETCVFVTLWTGDLSFRTPQPLPSKIYWCRPVNNETVSEDVIYTVSIASRHPDAGCHGDAEDDREVFCNAAREPLDAVVDAKVYHRLVMG